MKVAFATTDGVNVNEHFGRAGMFVIYELAREGHCLTETRKFSDGIDQEIAVTRDMGQVHDDKVQSKIDRLADCRIIYLTEIGGPSAARLVQKGIMPMKVKKIVPIVDAVRQLQEVVTKNTSPWIRKIMEKE